MNASATIEKIKEQTEIWAKEESKFAAGNKASGKRARAALMEVVKLAKQRRLEISDEKNADKPE